MSLAFALQTETDFHIQQAILAYFNLALNWYDQRTIYGSDPSVARSMTEAIRDCSNQVMYLVSRLSSRQWLMEAETIQVMMAHCHQQLQACIDRSADLKEVTFWWHMNWKSIYHAVLFGVQVPFDILEEFQDSYVFLQGQPSPYIQNMFSLF